MRTWLRGHAPQCIVLLALTGCVLRGILAFESPQPWGYVWDRTDEAVRLLYENGAVPESRDCWQCYHPPVFLYASLPFYWLGVQIAGPERMAEQPDLPLIALCLLPLLCVATVVFYCTKLLRLYEFEGEYLVLGFATAAILPCLFIASWGIEADILLTALMCAFLYEITVYTRRGMESSPWHVVVPALLAGLAAGTKYSGILAGVVAAALIVLKYLPEDRFRKMLRDLAIFLVIAFAVGGWKYVDNARKYGDPMYGNIGADVGFALEKELRFDLYEFTSLRLGEVIALMSPDGPEGPLTLVPPYNSVWTTLHAQAWSDMSFFSREGRHGEGWNMYPNKPIPVWLPASVLALALLPNALALLGAVASLRRRSFHPVLILSGVTLAVYFFWILSQTLWALKTKYVLFLLPPYLVFMLVGLQWLDRRLPSLARRAIWGTLAVLLLLTHVYMFEFAIR